MISTEYVQLMAGYTEWQNRSIFSAADSISDSERRLDRGAFFGSIHATLNHLLWGDQLWLHRLAGTPKPNRDDIAGSVSLHDEWDSLKSDRFGTDAAILQWSRRVTADSIRGQLQWYSGITGSEVIRPRWALVVQLFNHGTHHRGQVHAMLTAAGAKPQDTDIQFLDSDHYRW